jgi:sialate O-acetylesterase
MKSVLISLYLVILNGISWGQTIPIKPASIFGDNMVLQQGINVPVWGTAKPLEELTITFAGTETKTTVKQDGKWFARMPTLSYGGPFNLTISSSTNSVVLTNILVGEVWLASGQSNMQIPLTGANNSTQEIANAQYPK